MKFDLHVHAEERSGCSRSGEEDIIRAAIRFGLDGLAFTDHHRFVPVERLAMLNEKYAPFRILNGIEITLAEGEDVLVFGVRDEALEQIGWSYPDLHRFVRGRDGFIALAHAFRRHNDIGIDLERYPLDGIELHSKHIRSSVQPWVHQTMVRYDLIPLCNSDAHSDETVGVYYNDFVRSPIDERDLVTLLRRGSHACCGMRSRIAAYNQIIRPEDRVPLPEEVCMEVHPA